MATVVITDTRTGLRLELQDDRPALVVLALVKAAL
jgi:hypothetical protein